MQVNMIQHSMNLQLLLLGGFLYFVSKILPRQNLSKLVFLKDKSMECRNAAKTVCNRNRTKRKSLTDRN